MSGHENAGGGSLLSRRLKPHGSPYVKHLIESESKQMRLKRKFRAHLGFEALAVKIKINVQKEKGIFMIEE